MFRRPFMSRDLLCNFKRSILRDDAAVNLQAMVDDTMWLLQDSTDGSSEEREVGQTYSAFSSVPQSCRVLVEVENDGMIQDEFQQRAAVDDEPGDPVSCPGKVLLYCHNRRHQRLRLRKGIARVHRVFSGDEQLDSSSNSSVYHQRLVADS